MSETEHWIHCDTIGDLRRFIEPFADETELRRPLGLRWRWLEKEDAAHIQTSLSPLTAAEARGEETE